MLKVKSKLVTNEIIRVPHWSIREAWKEALLSIWILKQTRNIVKCVWSAFQATSLLQSSPQHGAWYFVVNWNLSSGYIGPMGSKWWETGQWVNDVTELESAGSSPKYLVFPTFFCGKESYWQSLRGISLRGWTFHKSFDLLILETRCNSQEISNKQANLGATCSG